MSASASAINDAANQYRSARNVDATDLVAGEPVRWDRDGTYPGLDIRSISSSCVDHFAGVLVDKIEGSSSADQRNNVLCTEGVVKVRFKGHASAIVGSYAVPVEGQDYMTYSAFPTGIILRTDMTSGTSVVDVTSSSAAKVWIQPGALRRQLVWSSPDVLDADGIFDGETITTAGEELVTADFAAQPDVARSITLIPKTNTADVAAGDVVITGTDIDGNTITDTLTFAANASTAQESVKAFKTVTSVNFPAQDGDTGTWDCGWGDKLGLPFDSVKEVPIATYFAGTLEGTAATVTNDADEIPKNLIDLNSALDGSRVDVLLAG